MLPIIWNRILQTDACSYFRNTVLLIKLSYNLFGHLSMTFSFHYSAEKEKEN